MDSAAAARIGRLRLALAGGGNVRFANEADIAAARRIEETWPGTGAQYAAALRFHSRAAEWAVTAGGCAGVVFGAAGYPPAEPPHRAAAQAAPQARFCYLSGSGESSFIAAGLLSAPGVAAARAFVDEAGEVAGLPTVRALGAPVMVQAQLCAHYWDDAKGRAVTARYASLLPPGSVLAMTLWLPDGTARGEAFLAGLSAAAGARAYGHSAASVRSWAENAGLEQAGPGVTDVHPRLRLAGRHGKQPAGRIVSAVYRVPR